MIQIWLSNSSVMQWHVKNVLYCPLQVGCQEGLGNRWIQFVLWFTQLHGLNRT